MSKLFRLALAILSLCLAPAAIVHAQSAPSYPAGLQLFSSPYDYPSVALDTLFGYSGVKLDVWQPATFAYALTPTVPADQVRLGQGYWARFPQAVTFASVGTPASTTQSFSFPLAAGWNQIGDPFAASIPIASLTFGSSQLTWVQSTTGASPLIDSTIWAYNASTNAYASSQTLDPQQGYWLYASAATAMQVPPPAGAATYTLTVVNGTGSGSYTTGTVVTITANAPLSGHVFSDWTGATVANANSASTTITMPAANTTVTANYTALVTGGIPFPVTTHPRLWINTTDIPRLQSWAVSTNPIYQKGMLPLINQVVAAYNTSFFPGGVAASPYPDPGDAQGYGTVGTNTNLSSDSEQLAVVLAFGSLIDPSAANRIRDAQYARNLIMYAMNLAVKGPVTGGPFQDPSFPIYNRANGSGQDWPLAIDWIYSATDAGGNPILTAADKATIRNVFMLWASECLTASTTGGDHPTPVGVTNDPSQLFPGNAPYRMASNNYYLGHARLLTMMALCIDPADDPPVNASEPVSQLGNSLRSYLLDANGAWLYEEYAMMGDPAAVAAAYGLSGGGAGYGLASGGLPPEGMLYGHSFGFVLGQLLALQTAGFNNVSYTGPQAQLITSPVWDRYVTGYFSSMTPTSKEFPGVAYMGPVYQFASYGDLLRLWVTPDVMQSFTLLDLLDMENGNSSHDAEARWFAVNAVEGGSGFLLSRASDPWSYGVDSAILYYLLLNPADAAAPDPRPSYPLYFRDPAAGRIVAHSDWTANGTLFDYRASWIDINHQDGDGGQFELFRKGEWLTKEMSNYDNNEEGLTTVYHNTLALKNWCQNGTPSNLQWYESNMWANGSEWMLGSDAGDPSTVSSTGPGYVYASSDLHNLFNRPQIYTPADAAMDITQATRSIVWVANDYIVVYDRATSVHSGLFKRFNMELVTNPVISGNIATETMADGQQLFVQTLLPASPTITASETDTTLNPIAMLEPTKYTMVIQDPTDPIDTRFLHVLQGADPGTSMAVATHETSTSGTAFDGAAFGSYAVYFPVSAKALFTGTTLPAPSGVTTMLVTGLTANASYGVSTANGTVTITTGGSSATADSAGVLSVSL